MTPTPAAPFNRPAGPEAQTQTGGVTPSTPALRANPRNESVTRTAPVASPAASTHVTRRRPSAVKREQSKPKEPKHDKKKDEK